MLTLVVSFFAWSGGCWESLQQHMFSGGCTLIDGPKLPRHAAFIFLLTMHVNIFFDSLTIILLFAVPVMAKGMLEACFKLQSNIPWLLQ